MQSLHHSGVSVVPWLMDVELAGTLMLSLVTVKRLEALVSPFGWLGGWLLVSLSGSMMAPTDGLSDRRSLAAVDNTGQLHTLLTMSSLF